MSRGESSSIEAIFFQKRNICLIGEKLPECARFVGVANSLWKVHFFTNTKISFPSRAVNIFKKKKTKYLVTIDRVNSMTCLWNISFKMPRWCKIIHNTTSSDRNDKEKLMSNTYNGAKWQSASSHRNNPATVNSDRDWELSVSPR